MPIFQILNNLLDIKLVQYLILLLLIGSTSFSIYYKTKSVALQLVAEQRKVAVQELEFNIGVQNSKILEYNEKFKLQTANLKTAQEKASQIALESQKTLQGILQYDFQGDCDQKVKQVGNTLKGEVH